MLLTRQYKELNSEQIEGAFEKMIHLVSVVEDMDPIEIQDWKAKKLIEAYTISQRKAKVSERYSERIEIAGHTLNLIPFTQLTLGQFINLEGYVSEDFTSNISNIASTIYLSQTTGEMHDPITEDYSKVNIEYRSNLIDDLPINSILGACKKYLTFRETFFKSYSLFSDPFADVDINELSDEEKIEYDFEMKEREKQGDNQWITILNMLSNNDITKFNDCLKQNLFLSFNQISWLKSNR